jgi:membrane protein DedA with SNARE-associated domain
MELLIKYGYSLVFGVVLLEQLGLPIPASPILLLAGALAAEHELSLPLVLLFSLIGCLTGDVIWYYIGRNKGRGILKILCHISLSPESCVKKTESSFLKYGMNSLLFAKFVPGLNTIAPPMAGMFRASLWSFLWRDALGSLLYSTAFVVTGLVFEKEIFDVTALLESLGKMVLWLILAGLGLYTASKYIKLKLLQRLLFRERITPEELHERMSAGEPIHIVDIRANFNDGHDGIIPGALRIPPGEIDNHVTKLSADRWIVMYCT